jgi:hypothetical protein
LKRFGFSAVFLRAGKAGDGVVQFGIQFLCPLRWKNLHIAIFVGHADRKNN